MCFIGTKTGKKGLKKLDFRAKMSEKQAKNEGFKSFLRQKVVFFASKLIVITAFLILFRLFLGCKSVSTVPSVSLF